MSENLTNKIEDLCNALDGTVGICARSTDGKHEYTRHSTDTYPTASTIKIFILYSLLKNKPLKSLEERLPITEQNKTSGSGTLMYLDDGLTPTLKDLATLMMMISDNTATNMIMDYLGIDKINEDIKNAGLQNTQLGEKIDFKTLSKDPSLLGTATPEDFVTLLLNIRQGSELSEENETLFWDIMRIQKYIEPLRKHLPCNPYAREYGLSEDVWVASKTGGLDSMRAESGLIHTPKTEWAISVMVKDMPHDINFSSLAQASQLISEISLLFYNEWS